MRPITTRRELIARWGRMRRSLAQFSGSDALCRTPWSAGYITNTSESKFSVHTCVDELRGFGDLVADFAAQAAAGLWQIHLGLSPQDVLRHSVAETCRIACWRRPRRRPVQ